MKSIIMQKCNILGLLLGVLVGCQNATTIPKTEMPFDKLKWQIKEGNQYVYRKHMVQDLLQHYTWKGLSKDSAYALLGKPDEIEEGVFLLYDYDQKLIGNFPLSTQSLVLELTADSSTIQLARDN